MKLNKLLLFLLFIILISVALYFLSYKKIKNIPFKKIHSNEITAYNNLLKIIEAWNTYYEIDWNKDAGKMYSPFLVELYKSFNNRANPIKAGFLPKKLAFAIGEDSPLKGYYYSDIHFKNIVNQDDSVKTVKMNFKKEWALLAIPKEYMKTGKLSFFVDQNDRIYAKDLEYSIPNVKPYNFINDGWILVESKERLIKLQL